VVVTLTEWVEAVCLDLDLSAIDIEPRVREVLDLTRDVAHGVERPAAPVTLLLIGLAAQGDPGRIPALVGQVRGLLPAA
jgi:hypothetical protein